MGLILKPLAQNLNRRLDDYDVGFSDVFVREIPTRHGGLSGKDLPKPVTFPFEMKGAILDSGGAGVRNDAFAAPRFVSELCVTNQSTLPSPICLR